MKGGKKLGYPRLQSLQALHVRHCIKKIALNLVVRHIAVNKQHTSISGS
jgi:hypothetical protein